MAVGSTPLWSKKRLSSMATTALRRSSSIWLGLTRMRASGERSVAILIHSPFLPLAQMPPSCASSGSSYWSSLGRSWAIAVTKPKKAETSASRKSRNATTSSRSQRRRRRRGLRASGGVGGGGVKRNRSVCSRLSGFRRPMGTGPLDGAGGPHGTAGGPTCGAGILPPIVCRTTFARSCATPSTCCPRARSSSAAWPRRAREGRPLRVKLGLDPTAVSVTLGWSVVLSKLRAFQDAGHLPVLIIGDFTARVGDPSGRSKTRPMLTPEQIDANAQPTTCEQFGRIIDLDARIELRRNSEWLGALGTGGPAGARRALHARAHARARRLRQALPRQRADLAAGAACIRCFRGGTP